MKVWLSPLILRSLNLSSLYRMIFPRHLKNSLLGITDTSHVLIIFFLSALRRRPSLYVIRRYLETPYLHNAFRTSDKWGTFFVCFPQMFFFSFLFALNLMFFSKDSPNVFNCSQAQSIWEKSLRGCDVSEWMAGLYVHFICLGEKTLTVSVKTSYK